MLTATFSCTREEVTGGMTEVLFTASAAQTRSSVTVHESDINTLDILVFRNETGALEASGRVSGDHLSLSVLKGIRYRWYAIANYPGDLAQVNSLSQLLGIKTRLDENSESSLVMSGYGDGLLDGTPVSVSLSRIVSRIELGTVSPVYYESAYAGEDVILDRIYLINAAGECSLCGDTDRVGVWYNEGKAMSNGGVIDSFLQRDRGVSIAGGVALQEDLFFYACPNPDAGTKLVLEVKVNDSTEYYPISIGPMKGNTSYRISQVLLLGPGATSPDADVERVSMSFDVTVNNWEEESNNVEL